MRMLFLPFLFFSTYAFPQWGANDSRTDYRDDAGLQGSAGAKSGFYETVSPVNYPSVASGWWHLLDVRHTNPANNYAMQFAGGFYDQDLYFRKTNDNPTTNWSKVILEREGLTKIGSVNPLYVTHHWVGYPDQTNNNAEISNDINQFKRLMIVGNRSSGSERRVGMWDKVAIGDVDYNQQLNVSGNGYFTGNLGVGQGFPIGKLHIIHNAVDKNIGNSTAVTNSLVIEAATQGRSAENGAQLEFAIPANADGNNVYGQGRIITVAGNGNSGDATGRMIIGTRRMFNKLGSGAQWYYGDDITIDGNGNVGINTLDTRTYKFAVNGNAAFAKVVVKNPGTWPDYVFDSSYQLPSLHDVETFVRQNRHLPQVPSASDVAQNGVDLGDNQAVLLKKIEELMLYIIEQNKRMNTYETKIKSLEDKINGK